jgi:hypothetical protein
MKYWIMANVFILLLLCSFILLTHRQATVFAMDIPVIFRIIAKNDLRKIQSERADLNDHDTLNALNKDLIERKK